MKKELHAVCGGSGAVGRAVIDELKLRGKEVIAVERKKEVPHTKTLHADLLDRTQAMEVLKNTTHIYLCVGLPYSNLIWKRDWPILMSNIIEASHQAGARLIFLDNIYMYGPSPLDSPFDENHTQLPPSPKGQARKEVADLLLKAHQEKRVNAVIGRSADFYGPYAKNSSLYIQFIENILKHKNPAFLGKKGVQHTFAYTVDVARALVKLALDETAYGQVWHLPVGKAITPDEVVDIINKILKTSYQVSYLPRPMLNVLKWFVPIIKEAKQMLYQFDYPYHMNDDKFRNQYPDFKVTDYQEGLSHMINSFK